MFEELSSNFKFKFSLLCDPLMKFIGNAPNNKKKLIFQA